MALNLGRKAYPERSSRIIPNVLSDIILIDNDISRAGFIRFWEMLRKTETKQEKITWDEDEFSPIIDTTSAAVSSTTTTVIPVTNPSYYLPGEIWQNKTTLEIFQVKEVNLGTGNIVVKRAVTALNSCNGSQLVWWHGCGHYVIRRSVEQNRFSGRGEQFPADHQNNHTD
jgi:hypothetical protein